MALLNPTIKAVTSLQVIDPEIGSQVPPDASELSFTAQERLEGRVYGVAGGGGSLTLNKASEGFTTLDLIRVEVLTPGKDLDVSINSAATPFTLRAVSSTDKAFMLMSADFTTLEFTNDDAAEVFVRVSMFEAKP